MATKTKTKSSPPLPQPEELFVEASSSDEDDDERESGEDGDEDPRDEARRPSSKAATNARTVRSAWSSNTTASPPPPPPSAMAAAEATRIDGIVASILRGHVRKAPPSTKKRMAEDNDEEVDTREESANNKRLKPVTLEDFWRDDEKQREDASESATAVTRLMSISKEDEVILKRRAERFNLAPTTSEPKSSLIRLTTSPRRAPVPSETMPKIETVLNAQPGFLVAVSDQTYDAVKRICAEAGMPAPLSREACDAVRHHLLIRKAQLAYPRVESSGVVERYEKGEAGLVQLAREAGDLPPLACLRAVLLRRGISRKNVRLCLSPSRSPTPSPSPHDDGNNSSNNNVAPSKKRAFAMMSERDVAQRNEALMVDEVTGAEQEESAAEAKEFEREIEAYLRKMNVALRTEHEVRRRVANGGDEKTTSERSEEPGEVALLTPDFLVESPNALEIDGRRVTWIDAKNFFGGISHALHFSDSRKQIAKYVDRFGPGAVIYSKGVCATHLSFFGPQVMVLDWENLREVAGTTTATTTSTTRKP